MDAQTKRQYLEAMGIHQWVFREAAESPVASVVEAKVVEESVRSLPTAPCSQPATNEVAVASDMEPPPSWLDEVPPPTEEFAETTLPGDDSNTSSIDEVAQLDWPQLAARVAECEACELHKSRKHTVFGIGTHVAKLMVIGEAPGAEEDRRGEPFVGRAGQLLNAMLGAIGLQREQVYIANILKCRPPGNRDPRPEEVVRCAAYLQRQVALVKPRVILAVGAVAARNLLMRDEAVGRLRAQEHRYRGIPLLVTYHPAYLLRSPEQKAKAWQDLQKAVRLIR